MFIGNITTWAILATIKNHDFYILILCIVRQIWASWYPKVPIRSTWATSTSRWASTTKQLNITGWLLIRSGCLLEFHLHVWRKFCQVPNTHKTMRIKIMHNIGVLFVKMGETFFIPCVGERYCQFVSLQVNTTMLAPLLNGSCQSRYFIFFKFLRGDNIFPRPHPKRAISSAKTTAQYTSSKTRATSKPASTWSCVTTPPETKTGWRRASPSLWRFRLRFEVPCDETVQWPFRDCSGNNCKSWSTLLGGGRGQVSTCERRPDVQPDPGGDQERRPEEDGES